MNHCVHIIWLARAVKTISISLILKIKLKKYNVTKFQKEDITFSALLKTKTAWVQRELNDDMAAFVENEMNLKDTKWTISNFLYKAYMIE